MAFLFFSRLRPPAEKHSGGNIAKQFPTYLPTCLPTYCAWARAPTFQHFTFLTPPPSIVTYHIIVANAIVDKHFIWVFDGSATSVLYKPGCGLEMQT
jgi:hypothetical protein